jgi:hypothetical protein
MDFTVMLLTQRQGEKRRVVAKADVMLLNRLFCAAQCATRLITWTLVFARPHVSAP